MKKRLIIPCIISIIGVLLIFLGHVYSIKISTTTNVNQKNFKVEENLTIDMCKDKSTCDVSPIVKYHMINLKNINEDLQKIIDKINQTTKNNYDTSLKSTLDDPICENVRDKYKHSLVYYLDYNLFENDDFITIDIIREESNLCTNENIKNDPEVYVYSKKDQKIISQETFKKKLDITKEEIELAIRQNIELSNKFNKILPTYENTFQRGEQKLSLYYTADGTLYTYYFQNEDQKYHSARIR